MTREQKLALIIGFALVLVVGVLVSDHLSAAREASGATGETGLARALSEPEERAGLGRRVETMVVYRDPSREAVSGVRLSEAELDLNPEPEPEPVRTAHATAERPVRFFEDEPESPAGGWDGGAAASSVAERAGRAWDGLARGAERVGELLTEAQGSPAVAQFEVLEMGRPVETPRSGREAGAGRSGAADADAVLHHVTRGENLWKIAERYYGDGRLHAALARQNDGRVMADGGVRLGSSLLIPAALESDYGVVNRRVGARVSRGGRESVGSSSSAARRDVGGTPRVATTYTVRRGDTLSEISQSMLGTSKRYREIMRLNDLDDATDLWVGMELRLPAG